MAGTDELKGELAQLVFSGRKEEALRVIQDKYSVSRDEAEKLLAAAIKDSVNPQLIFKFVGSRLSGVKSLLFKVAAIVCGFFAIPMLLMAAVLFAFDAYRVSNSYPATGVVIELKSYSYDATQFVPVIEYKVGNEIFKITGTAYESPPAYIVGDSVPLYIDSADSGSAVIDSYSERFMVITVVGMIGTLLLALMIFLIRKSRRKVAG